MIIVPDDGTEPREYAPPRGVHVNVHEGERVRAGEQLKDGPSNPHDMAGSPARTLARWGAVLRVLGEKELQKYLPADDAIVSDCIRAPPPVLAWECRGRRPPDRCKVLHREVRGRQEEIMSQRLNASAAEASTAGIGRETGAGPMHWYERYNAKSSRAWMISDSPDGRIPAMTPQAQQRLVSGDAAPAI